MMVTSPGPGLFSHQRFLTVLRFQPVAVKMSRYRASVRQTHLLRGEGRFGLKGIWCPCRNEIFYLIYCYLCCLLALLISWAPERAPSLKVMS